MPIAWVFLILFFVANKIALNFDIKKAEERLIDFRRNEVRPAAMGYNGAPKCRTKEGG